VQHGAGVFDRTIVHTYVDPRA